MPLVAQTCDSSRNPTPSCREWRTDAQLAFGIISRYRAEREWNHSGVVSSERGRTREKEGRRCNGVGLCIEHGGWSHLSRSRWSRPTEKETPPRSKRVSNEFGSVRNFVQFCSSCATLHSTCFVAAPRLDRWRKSTSILEAQVIRCTSSTRDAWTSFSRQLCYFFSRRITSGIVAHVVAKCFRGAANSLLPGEPTD